MSNLEWPNYLPKNPNQMTYEEWQSYIAGLSQNDQSQRYQGIHSSLIPAVEMIRQRGLGKTDPYAGISPEQRPGAANPFGKGYQPPEVNKVGFFAGKEAPTASVAGSVSMLPPMGPVRGIAKATTKVLEEGKLLGIEAALKAIIIVGRQQGYPVAADNLQHYLSGSGTPRRLDPEWLKSQQPIADAIAKSTAELADKIYDAAYKLREGETKEIKLTTNERIFPYENTDLYYASNQSKLDTTSIFKLRALQVPRVAVRGEIVYRWHDTYDWHKGLSVTLEWRGLSVNWKDEYSEELKESGRAKEFRMESTWREPYQERFWL